MKKLSFLLIAMLVSTFSISGCAIGKDIAEAKKQEAKHNAKVWQKQEADKAQKELDKY